MATLNELWEEFRTVFSGRNSIIDIVLPPLIFVVVNALLGFEAAMFASLVVGTAMALIRLWRKQPVWNALGGLAGAALAVGLAFWFKRSEVYFLPTLVSSALTVLALLVSIIIKKPLAAFSSHLTRRWSLEWYWHPQVQPAYLEVTAFWLLYSVIKLGIQYYFYEAGEPQTLAWVNTLLGWPALVLVLAGSYIYGIWRLQRLYGPSVEEFLAGANPPWQGQKRGF